MMLRPLLRVSQACPFEADPKLPCPRSGRPELPEGRADGRTDHRYASARRWAPPQPGRSEVGGHHFHVCGKRGRERIIPVSSQFFVALGEYLELERPPAAPCEACFVVLKGPRRGLALSAAGLDEVLDGARVRAGLSNATCHQPRHTCLTRLREQGMALEAVQAQAGHASIESTRIYLHLSNDYWRVSIFARRRRSTRRSTRWRESSRREPPQARRGGRGASRRLPRRSQGQLEVRGESDDLAGAAFEEAAIRRPGHPRPRAWAADGGVRHRDQAGDQAPR